MRRVAERCGQDRGQDLWRRDSLWRRCAALSKSNARRRARGQRRYRVRGSRDCQTDPSRCRPGSIEGPVCRRHHIQQRRRPLAVFTSALRQYVEKRQEARRRSKSEWVLGIRSSIMAASVGDFIVSRLTEWGVTRIYGYPGDGINGILGALDRAGDRPRFIQARHEELAAFMACAHAKFTGRVGVCLATSGPGAIHLLNGLYDAKMDHQPVVAIMGQAATTAMGSAYQQEVDLQNLFKDVAAEFVQTVASPAAMRHCIDRAIRIALDQHTVTCVIIPKDIQEEKAVPEPPQKHNYAFSGIGYPVPHVIPKRPELEAAAKVLNEGTKVAMLVGQGAMNATDEVMQIAELLGAGVAKAWLGKA